MMHPVAYGRTAQLNGTTTDKSSVDPRLKPAAHEFEASLLQELMKPLEHDPLFSDSSSSSGLVTGDAGMGSWSSLGTQSLAKAISDAGGLGIARKMIQEVEAEAKAQKAAARTDANSAAENKGMSLSVKNEHLEAWSVARRLP